MNEESWFIARFLKFILCLDEHIPWYTGYVFMGMNLKRQEQGWFLVVAAKRPGGERVVAFYGAASPWDCFMALAGDVSHRRVTWRLDKYR